MDATIYDPRREATIGINNYEIANGTAAFTHVASLPTTPQYTLTMVRNSSVIFFSSYDIGYISLLNMHFIEKMFAYLEKLNNTCC